MGDDIAPGACRRVGPGLWVMGADLRCSPSLCVQQAGTHRIETGVLLEEPSCHLWLTSQAAEIDDGAGMGNGLGADGDGLRSSVGDCNTALGQAGWAGVSDGNTRTCPILARKGDSI